jgi:hypothetical protein
MHVVGARVGTVVRVGVSTFLVAGCAYQADSFSYEHSQFKGTYVTVDCLDLAIEHRNAGSDQNVIAYQFGNRCDVPVLVDLAAARVVARTVEGDEMQLIAFDPRHEIRPMRIDARASGKESIEYPSGRDVQSVCVDAASVARVLPERWICFNHRD